MCSRLAPAGSRKYRLVSSGVGCPVYVTEGLERKPKWADGFESSHRNLYVDNRFGREPDNRRRAYVVDADRNVAESQTDPRSRLPKKSLPMAVGVTDEYWRGVGRLIPDQSSKLPWRANPVAPNDSKTRGPASG